jgi:hypothetical protein
MNFVDFSVSEFLIGDCSPSHLLDRILASLVER